MTAIVETLESLPALPDDVPDVETLTKEQQQREAYALNLAGHSAADIATLFDVDRRTIYRWLKSYEKRCRERLESTPVVDLISQECERLTDLEDTARRNADTTESEKSRATFLNTALKAAKARQELLIRTGVIPEEPTKLYSVTTQMKPDDLTADGKPEARDPDAIRQDIQKLLENSRTL